MDTKALLQQRLADLRAEVEALKAEVAPDRARLDGLIEQQNALDAEIDAVTALWRRNHDALIAKKEEIATIANALGAKRLLTGG